MVCILTWLVIFIYLIYFYVWLEFFEAKLYNGSSTSNNNGVVHKRNNVCYNYDELEYIVLWIIFGTVLSFIFTNVLWMLT